MRKETKSKENGIIEKSGRKEEKIYKKKEKKRKEGRNVGVGDGEDRKGGRRRKVEERGPCHQYRLHGLYDSL